jgi:hypothetical protein
MTVCWHFWQASGVLPERKEGSMLPDGRYGFHSSSAASESTELKPHAAICLQGALAWALQGVTIGDEKLPSWRHSRRLHLECFYRQHL